MNRQGIRKALRDRPLDWLLMLLVSWLVPLGLLGRWGTTYLWSLTLWAAPIVVLFPRFLSRTRNEPNVRRAFNYTVVYIFVGGCILDLVFGFLILCFDCNHDTYIWRLPPVVKAAIPIEELLFYLLGAYAVTLVYFWADRYWLANHHVVEAHEDLVAGPLVQFSINAFAIAVAGFALGVCLKVIFSRKGWFPTYFTFLDVVAFAPALALYRKVKRFVNWRAFSFTTLYVMLTACIWEVTLALPRRWWGYQRDAMIGLLIDPWSRTPVVPSECPIPRSDTFGEYPFEALLVWLTVSFAAILMFEGIKIYHHDPRPTRVRLIG